MKKNIKKKGFTLIEMVAVVAIIGILAAILVPKVTGYMKEAKKTGVVDQARKVTQAFETAVMKEKLDKADIGSIHTDNIVDPTMLSLLDDSTTAYTTTLGKIQGVDEDGNSAGPNQVSIQDCKDIVDGAEFEVTSKGELIVGTIVTP